MIWLRFRFRLGAVWVGSESEDSEFVGSLVFCEGAQPARRGFRPLGVGDDMGEGDGANSELVYSISVYSESGGASSSSFSGICDRTRAKLVAHVCSCGLILFLHVLSRTEERELIRTRQRTRDIAVLGC